VRWNCIAYADFGAESAIGLINDYPNLLISQTFSKGRSLAGLRLGTAYGDANLIQGLVRVKDSFNSYPVDAIAQSAGIASIEDETYYRTTTQKIINTREKLTAELGSRGFSVLPSAANFVFASPKADGPDASEIFKYLNERNVLIRYWNKPVLRDWLRISIGSDQDTDKFLSVLDSFL